MSVSLSLSFLVSGPTTMKSAVKCDKQCALTCCSQLQISDGQEPHGQDSLGHYITYPFCFFELISNYICIFGAFLELILQSFCRALYPVLRPLCHRERQRSRCSSSELETQRNCWPENLTTPKRCTTHRSEPSTNHSNLFTPPQKTCTHRNVHRLPHTAREETHMKLSFCALRPSRNPCLPTRPLSAAPPTRPRLGV